jgi:DNA-binding CsgD family transcriptional regulator
MHDYEPRLDRQPAFALQPSVAFLTIVNAPEWHATIDCQERTIGRGSGVAIRIPDRFRSVSRKHASIWADHRCRLWIRDLRSRLGTAVNGVLLTSDLPVQIVTGDRLLLGDLEMDLIDDRPINAERDDRDASEVEETRRCPAAVANLADAPAELVEELTPAELEIVLWLCRGFTRLQAIGRNLHRSPHTVRTQLGNIFRKTGVHSREELLGRFRRAWAGESSESSQPVRS